MTPRATILIPSFNHAPYVVEAVRSALAQTEPDVEVLVIDDGSTDDSLARLAELRDPRLQVFAQANMGLSRTLNRGLELARARWVKFLPSDDALEPECIARELAAAEADPRIGVVFALPLVVDAAGAPLADPAPQAWFDVTVGGRDDMLRGLLERNFLCAPSALFARERARAVGGFDPSLVVAQDYDLWLKILADAEAVLLQERLVRVRWHGANQSAHVTPATEAERARVVVGALERLGLERWIELFRDRDAAAGEDAERRARHALAAALERASLHELAPYVQRLRDDAVSPPDAAGVSAPGVASAAAAVTPAAPRPHALPPHASRTTAPVVARERPSLVARLGRLVARLVRGDRSRARDHGDGAEPPAPTIPPGPRVERWIVAGHAAKEGAPSRGERLARALAAAGVEVTWVPHAEAARNDVQPARAGALRVEPWNLARLRALLQDHDARVRLVLQTVDAEAVALAREARLRGVRVLYDKTEAAAALTSWADVETERALVEAADDLVGASRPLVKQLAVHRRPVHLLPDPADDAGWSALAASLRSVTARPTVAVVVIFGADTTVADVAECLGAVVTPADGPLRVVAIDDGVSDAVLEDLDAREERRELQLLRNPRRGPASARNLALRASGSEMVVLLDARHRAPGPGWLASATARLLGERRLGALVVRGAPGASWAWLAPRAVLARAGGFDEAYDPGTFEDHDLERRLRSLGYEVADWPAPAPRPAPARTIPEAELRRAARHYERRWRVPPPSTSDPARVR